MFGARGKEVVGVCAYIECVHWRVRCYGCDNWKIVVCEYNKGLRNNLPIVLAVRIAVESQNFFCAAVSSNHGIRYPHSKYLSAVLFKCYHMSPVFARGLDRFGRGIVFMI